LEQLPTPGFWFYFYEVGLGNFGDSSRRFFWPRACMEKSPDGGMGRVKKSSCHVVRILAHYVKNLKIMPNPSPSYPSLSRLFRWMFALFTFACGGAGSAVACGLRFNLPPTPFVGYGDYRFSHWEEWGKIKPDPKAKLEFPIHVGWTPIPEMRNSPILGEGWTLSLFESTLVPENPTTYTWRQPFGFTERLTKDPKKPGILFGSGWLAEIHGSGAQQVVVCKSSCGEWQLTYKGGRLAQLRSKEASLDFTYEKSGARQIASNGKVVATLKREFDTATTHPYWRLSFLSEKGMRHATLKLGTRTVLIHADKKPDQRRNSATLKSVKFDGEPERSYDFTANTLKIAGHLYKWDTKKSLLEQSGLEKYSFVTIKGVKCFKTIFPDGRSCLYGDNKRFSIQKAESHDKVVITENVFVPKNKKPRTISVLESDGRETLLKRFWYDETGNVIRQWVKNGNGGIIFEKKKLVESAKDSQTNEILWEKFCDENGNLSLLRVKKSEYGFSYLNKDGTPLVKLTQKSTGAERIMSINEFNLTMQEFLGLLTINQ
jgi:hypothetical protein